MGRTTTLGIVSRFDLLESGCRTGTRTFRPSSGTAALTRVFKDLLAAEGRLEEWYAFEAESTERALRDWCKANEIHVAENDGQQSA
jgi:hypothetical protein